MLSAVTFSAATGELSVSGEVDNDDVVTVSAVDANFIEIQLDDAALTLNGDAIDNPNFELSTDNVADDTLRVNLSGALVSSINFDLGEGNDSFFASGDLSVLSAALNFTVDGGEGDDTLDVTESGLSSLLIGGVGNDILSGGFGDDTLAGGGGTDTITGGDGSDTNSFEGIGIGVVAAVNADGSGTATYGPVSEAFTGIENLTGSDNNDELRAFGVANNVLLGGLGDDILAGGGGTDIIEGGAGNDTNSFDSIGFGVVAVVNADGTGTAEYGPVNETFAGIENLTGSANNDELRAVGVANNILIGGLGDDILAGGGGADIIDGGAGIDTNSFEGIGFGVLAVVNADGSGTAVYGPVSETFAGIENLTGSDNNDELRALGVANNVLLGGLGDDILAGGGGTDIIDGGAGIDTNSFESIGFGVLAVVNADGSGTAEYGPVSETFAGIENLTGSDNNDELRAFGAVNNVLIGGLGDDTLAGGGGTDIIDGGAGIDTNSFEGIGLGVVAVVNADGSGTAVYGPVNETFAGIENLTGSDNNDDLSAFGAVSNVLIGGLGDDIITGGGGADLILGGDGFDILRGGGGNDSVNGQTGADLVFGGAGADELRGGADNDGLVGGGGADLLFGGAGDDSLAGSFGADELRGGVGNDTLLGGDGNDLAIGGQGDDSLTGETGNDELRGGAGNDLLFGNSGNDLLIGNAGADLFGGGAGNDSIIGGAGDDVAAGNSGQDVLVGNGGDDSLSGGSGQDEFIGGAGTDTLFASGGGIDLLQTDLLDDIFADDFDTII